KLVVKEGAAHGWPDLPKDLVRFADWFDEHLKKPVPSRDSKGPTEAKDDTPPRKVVVGTAIFGPYGKYPGLEARLEVLGGLVGEMARQASERPGGRGLDLAILPETTVTATGGKAHERALPLRGRVREALGALAQKHKTYLLAPMDLVEEGDQGTTCA